MLTIPFSHRYLKMPPGFNPEVDKTYLLDYCVQDVLPKEFIEYDTLIGEPGHHQGHPRRYFKLPEKGPYLIMFLATIYGSMELEHDWTTVRCPWRRQGRDCVNCARVWCNRCLLSPLGPCFGWQPIIPAKYVEARGKEVRVEIKEAGK